MNNEKVQAALNSVEAFIADLASETDAFQQSTHWKSILSNAAKFHNYSITNQLLIASQCKGATYVAGFQRWKSLGRHVIKGSKGIAILVPCILSKTPPVDSQTGLDASEESVESQGKDSFIWFRTGYVFDISMTSGKPLPQLELPQILDDKGTLPLVKAAVEDLGIEVRYEEFSQPDLKGVSKNGYICVRGSLPPGDMASVLIHEAAHELVHQGNNRERAQEIGKTMVEIEAESTAYVVMRHLGIESTANLYLASYGANGKAIKAALSRVTEASSRLIAAIERARAAEHIEGSDGMKLPLAPLILPEHLTSEPSFESEICYDSNMQV